MKENSNQSIVIYLRRTYPIGRTIKSFLDVLGICIYWTSTKNYPSCVKNHILFLRSCTYRGVAMYLDTLYCILLYTSTNAYVTETWLRTERILFYGGGSWTYARQQTAPVFIAWATLFIRSYFVLFLWVIIVVLSRPVIISVIEWTSRSKPHIL